MQEGSQYKVQRYIERIEHAYDVTSKMLQQGEDNNLKGGGLRGGNVFNLATVSHVPMLVSKSYIHIYIQAITCRVMERNITIGPCGN